MSEYRELRITRRDGSEHVVLYDTVDAAIVESQKWHIKPDSGRPDLFYARTSQKWNGKWVGVSMHVLLMGRPGVDHINHNGLDNRRSNLRPASKSQNAANQRPVSDSSSQYKGVGWKKRSRRWVARIKVSGEERYLGCFVDEMTAAKAYDRAALDEFGEFAHINFPAGDPPS